MMSMLLALLLVPAGFAGHHVVRAGDTLASIAEARLGSAARADEVRTLNGLAPDASLVPGTVLEIPELPDAGADAGAGKGAHVSTLRGSGTVTLPSGQEVPLALGMDLADGAIVCTDADSFTRLRLVRSRESFAHDDLSLLPQTCLVVESTRAEATGRAALVRLQSGAIAVHDGDGGDGEVAVQSGDGVTTGATGGFRVALEEAATRTEAVSGAVAVISGGTEIAVEAGFGSRTRAGQAPDAPTPLYGPLVLLSPADGALLLRPRLSWAVATDFLGYRLELSTNPDFTDVVLLEELTAEVWAPELLFLPFRGVEGLWWRVSVFDRIGFLGLPSAPRELTFPEQMGP